MRRSRLAPEVWCSHVETYRFPFLLTAASEALLFPPLLNGATHMKTFALLPA